MHHQLHVTDSLKLKLMTLGCTVCTMSQREHKAPLQKNRAQLKE